ncbi:kinase-like domain-containing protein [Rhodotorula diobovata]|uniref:Kinase-like domain-containing protein n=1 Tax=Rhodotorula diobovata TaxID=5288 RepID=A0A5C5FP75_9BASI|nr:kinase-like domain-containing protein [Rhodotorula diobovata]
MESAVMDALDFSQQSQFTQTQPQTQQQSQPAPSASSRFPPSLWGILLSVSSSSSSSSANHDPSAPPPPGAPAGPSSRPTARVLLPRPDRLDLVKGREAYTVGRSPRCDLVLNGPKISSFQARIALGEDGVVRLEDTSTNGTFVRMRKVGKGNVTILESGDTIVFGPPADSFELEFRYVIQIDPSLSPRADPSSADADADAYDPFHLGELSQSQSQGRPAPIFAAYEVREQIGKGSFATVRKGVRRSDGRIVALKIIQKARFASNPKTMEMIEREVEIMKGLEHRFCVKCIDYFEDDQRIWLVLEYVDGGDLLDYVMKRGGLKESETREIALMVCEAVAYLHSKGITHRDLKPENLLLTRGAKPVCKVTDFGLAKMVDEGTMLKTMCGTPTYLAPEVILNPTPLAGYGSLVDAWSIGVVLYSCLTNQTPFDESESTPLPQRMRQRRVDTTVLVECGVSEVACDFLLRLLVPDPTKRMSCAEALQHPWLALKTPTPATATAAAPVAAPTTISAAALLASTLPFNDPLASPALEGDESVTRFHDEGSSRSRAGEEDGAGGGGGGAAGEGSMLLEEEDSGVDSQGFGASCGLNLSPARG